MDRFKASALFYGELQKVINLSKHSLESKTSCVDYHENSHRISIVSDFILPFYFLMFPCNFEILFQVFRLKFLLIPFVFYFIWIMFVFYLIISNQRKTKLNMQLCLSNFECSTLSCCNF